MRTPLLAIVGRPNVGKSTLFNRILGERKAIVEDFPGVTRDRNYHYCTNFEIPFTLIDTGGFETSPQEELAAKVVEQTQAAAEEADIIIAVFDGDHGLHPEDYDLVTMIRRYKKPLICAVNKCDGPEHAARTAEFYSLGLPEFFDVSALHGRKVKDLVRETLRSLPDYEELKESFAKRSAIEEFAETHVREEMVKIGIPLSNVEEEEAEEEEFEIIDEPIDREPTFGPVHVEGESNLTATEYDYKFGLIPKSEHVEIDYSRDEIPEEYRGEIDENQPAVEDTAPDNLRIALIGRPNVGKSTLFNSLLGEERAIVSPIAGTTRDALDVTVEREGQKYTFVDTAGLRKIGRIVDTIEKFSTIRSLAAISSSDVAVLLIDAEEGVTEQDTRVAGIAHEQGRALIIAVNKWDLVEKDHRTAHEFKLDVKEKFKFAPYAEHIFISAKSGRRTTQLFPLILEAAKSRLRRIGTRALNQMLQKELRRVSPPNYRGGPVKVFYAAQINVAPPVFMLVVNYPRGMHFSYLRFIKNAVREKFGFTGTDLKFKVTSRRRATPT